MIKIYFSSSDTSSRKALNWLKRHNLRYEAINWNKEGMTLEDFFELLSLTETGTQEIIAKKSLPYLEFAKHMNNLSLEEMLAWIHCQKSLLRLPLIVDENHLQVGYNEDDIRQFIPQEVREVRRKNMKF
ncbi:Spx/MgsR family RNA polymerase-binding regulatory protein [Lactococcus garvieae]|uniref:Spx/MgsR family RNA polymerase-binding regulatory protein n=1 Tax=Lactococcus garvieae TaxID=1363 RepID=UPI001F618E67|nr:Spx/MgsR family RNA polymerase-binding regulatory protein [Lactococcus garvieae]MCI3861378.1 Spx/MgsR family RNA polymerase-binding regulatory protein [Lactococcus garvieae]